MRYEMFRNAVIDRLTQLVQEKNLSIKALCDEAHVSKSSVYKFMQNPNASITLDTLDKLCSALGIGFDEFFNTPDFKA